MLHRANFDTEQPEDYFRVVELYASLLVFVREEQEGAGGNERQR